jgi:hypothetical protein
MDIWSVSARLALSLLTPGPRAARRCHDDTRARAPPGPSAPQYQAQSVARAPVSPGNIEDGAMMHAKVTFTNGLTGPGAI